jgi:hypothetical protein
VRSGMTLSSGMAARSAALRSGRLGRRQRVKDELA